MMSLWDALRMNMMISYQELVRTFLRFSQIQVCITDMMNAVVSIKIIVITTIFTRDIEPEFDANTDTLHGGRVDVIPH
ncbi:hypothetical protein AB185_34385 [Klebsiella oxytoca]|nr:hypothetical protein AB185_34385 [Klebsiella oxytoca]